MPNVLVVEDSALMRVVIVNFIKSLPGYTVVAVAENGKKALGLLDKVGKGDLILTDIEMPEMDGLEFLRHAKMKSRAKVAILSSVAATGSPRAAEARKLGADAIISKPSGAVSADLADKRGAELAKVIKTLAPA